MSALENDGVPVFRVGSLIAIGEIMLILWLVSMMNMIAGTAILREDPLQAASRKDTAASEADYKVLVGPDREIRLNGDRTGLNNMLTIFKKADRPGRIELAQTLTADPTFYFRVRYALRRDAGVSYDETPPVRAAPRPSKTRGKEKSE